VGSEAKTSKLLESQGFRHAFFTRLGGVSPAPFASLNFAANTGDSLENVARNLEVAGAALGVPADKVYFLSQVHGVDALEVGAALDRTEVVYREGDATFSTEGSLACGVRSADCGTVLVGDRRSGAALAIHSGWQGTVKRIVPIALARFRERLGGTVELVAAVGPMIEVCCFEVGDDVAAELSAASPLGEAAVDRSRAKAHVDLRRILEAQLAEAGVAIDQMEHVRGCTMCNPGEYFSFRREGKVSGRMLAAIVPRPSESRRDAPRY